MIPAVPDDKNDMDIEIFDDKWFQEFKHLLKQQIGISALVTQMNEVKPAFAEVLRSLPYEKRRTVLDYMELLRKESQLLTSTSYIYGYHTWQRQVEANKFDKGRREEKK